MQAEIAGTEAPTPAVTIDTLRRFCAQDATRGALCSPFSRGPYTYASNGHICVRVPRMADVPEYECAPPAEILFESIPDSGEWCQWPEHDKPGSIHDREHARSIDPCYACRGVGCTPMDCPDCGGEGDHECSCGDFHVCGKCNGLGAVEAVNSSECNLCGGDGRLFRQRVAGLSIKGTYHRMVADLLIEPEHHQEPLKRPDGLQMVLFRFYGGHGVIMPLREPAPC